MAPTTVYRRKREKWSYQEWHYSRRCTEWPDKDYEEAWSEPHTGHICRQCERLEKPKPKYW